MKQPTPYLASVVAAQHRHAPLLYALTFTTITAVCAQTAIVIPGTPVPVTLQVFAVLLSGMVLGSRLGAVAQVQYLLAGAIGLPVFAGGGGLLHLFGPRGTGGYLLAFPIAAWLAGSLKGRLPFPLACAIGGLAGVAVIHLFGVLWYGLLMGVNPAQMLWQGSLPFVGGDIAKLCAAVVIAGGLHKVWHR